MIEPSFDNDMHAMIFESYMRGIGMTPRMVTNLETGENYRSGQQASDILGVTRQAVNNCVHGRQGTVGGYHLVLAASLRREMMKQFVGICRENGTDYQEVIEEFRSME